MTKEKPIGLLIGLVFIIMFGLVLSELTGTKSLPPAPAAVEENVESYTQPPLIEEYVPVTPAPAGPVAGDRTIAGPPGAVVETSWAVAPVERNGIIESEIRLPTTVLAATHGARVADAAATWVGAADAQAPGGLAFGPAPAPSSPPVGEPRVQIHKVEANDSLIRIARKVYGAGNEMQYKRIFEANQRILPDESTLSIGQELVIPPLPSRPAPSPETPRPAPPSGAPPAAAAPRGPARDARHVEADLDDLSRRLADSSSPSRTQRVYVVQRGDSLTDIARRVLRDDSPSVVRKLFHANRDRLESPDRLPVGVRLNLPI